MYRARIGTDPARRFKTLFGALRYARDQFVEDAKHGLFRELALEFRLATDTTWYVLPADRIEHAAREMRLENWKPGRAPITTTKGVITC